MKKNKIIVLIFSLFIIFTFFSFAVSASETTVVYNGTHSYTTKSEEVFKIVDGVEHIINHGDAYSDNGATVFKDRIVHIFKANIKNNSNIKLVSWQVQKENSGFTRDELLDIAKNYEETHPGWVVLAGTNADQFYTGYGTGLGSNGTDYFYPQPYYPLISDGDNLFAYSPYASCNNVVGFKNDDSDVQMVYGNRSIKGLFVHVYDNDNNLVGSFPCKDLNYKDTLGSNETTVLSTRKVDGNDVKDFTKTTSNDVYVIEKPDLSYVSNSVEWTWKKYNVNAFFGKGKISKVTNGEVTLHGTQFAIETTNNDLKRLLNTGVYVKCQYEFDEGFDGIEEAAGFHTVQMLNGVPQNVSNGYNNPNYPRSIFGCDDKGNVYLITTEKSTAPKDGLKAQEANALMLQYGITNAFQCDGGGSVQSIARNEEGVLVYAQSPYEGSYRPVLTANLIVMKVENISLDISNVTNNTCDIKISDNENKYKNMAIQLKFRDDEEEVTRLIEAIDGEVKLEGLNKKTNYTVKVLVKEEGMDHYKEAYLTDSFTTLADPPIITSIKVSKELDGSYKVDIVLRDVDNVYVKSALYQNSKKQTIKFNNNTASVILDKNTTNILDLYLEIDCNFYGSTKTIIYDDLKLDCEASIYLSDIQSRVIDFFNFK